MNFRKGDRCVIKSKERQYDGGHPYPDGTLVTLLVYDSPSWQCTDASGDRWWVFERDLVLADDGPSEEEVLQLFGIIEKPHCETCTCHERSET